MRWKVTGADATTGDERTVELPAASREEAEKTARYNGMLVSNVERADVMTRSAELPTLDYPGPNTTDDGESKIPSGQSPSSFMRRARKQRGKRLTDPTMTLGEALIIGLFLIVALFLLINGFGRMAMAGGPSPNSFHSDNAIGETANAMLRVEKSIESLTGAVFVCTGLLFVLCAGMIRIRVGIRLIHRQRD